MRIEREKLNSIIINIFLGTGMKIIRFIFVLFLFVTLTACQQSYEKKLANGETVEVSGIVLSGGDTSQPGLMDAPLTFVYLLRLDDNSEINIKYSSFPPMPEKNKTRKIVLDFYQGEIVVGDYLLARGRYNLDENTVVVEEEGDYIKTIKEKP